MLLELARWLQEFARLFALFDYITMRAILGALTALALSLWLGPAVIERLSRLKGGQPIRTDGPQSHFSKAGTPTMGGALILMTISLSTLLWADLRNRYVWIVLAVLVCFGLIGWLDDWIKIVRRDPNGLKSRHKYALQSLFGAIAAMVLFYTADAPSNTTLYLPLLKDVAIPLGGMFMVVAYFWIVGFSNAVNLTDGLDGIGCRRSRHLRLCVRQRGVLGLSADPRRSRRRRTRHRVRRHCRCGSGLSLVQHLSGHGIHGRHRCLGARCRARRDCGHRAPGTDSGDHGRHLRD
jgi:hypothetical protein